MSTSFEMYMTETVQCAKSMDRLKITVRSISNKQLSYIQNNNGCYHVSVKYATVRYGREILTHKKRSQLIHHPLNLYYKINNN